MTSTASESSESSPSTSGECVVCGKRCTMRCSACKANGCDWMYFCSTEHQKLIWSLHKRVCGENAAPFHWPLLSEFEAIDARSLLTAEKAYRASADREFVGLLCANRKSVLTVAEIEEIIGVATQSLVMRNPAAEVCYTLAALVRRQFFCLKLCQRHDSTCRHIGSAYLMAAISRDPLGAMARFVDSVRGVQAIMPVGSGPSFFDPLLHKVLVHFTLLAFYYKDTHTICRYRELLQNTREEIIRYCREVVKPRNAEVARVVQQNLIHSFSEESFQPVPASMDRKSVWESDQVCM